MHKRGRAGQSRVSRAEWLAKAAAKRAVKGTRLAKTCEQCGCEFIACRAYYVR